MNAKIVKWWRGLSSAEKFRIVLIGILLAWLIYRLARGVVEGVGSTVQSQSTLVVLQSQGVKPTYKQADYEKFAGRLEYAMKGAGTSEQIIYNVFKYMKNDADLVKLNQTFGIRENETLNQWLKGDLESYEISNINADLKDRGMTKLIK